MRAVVYRGINDLRLETVPVPRIGAHELLVKVAVCGVCPTDIKKIQHGAVPPPRIFGHETAGTIVKMGSGVSRLGFGCAPVKLAATRVRVPPVELDCFTTESRVREEAARPNPKARPGLNCPVATTVNLIE